MFSDNHRDTTAACVEFTLRVHSDGRRECLAIVLARGEDGVYCPGPRRPTGDLARFVSEAIGTRSRSPSRAGGPTAAGRSPTDPSQARTTTLPVDRPSPPFSRRARQLRGLHDRSPRPKTWSNVIDSQVNRSGTALTSSPARPTGCARRSPRSTRAPHLHRHARHPRARPRQGSHPHARQWPAPARRRSVRGRGREVEGRETGRDERAGQVAEKTGLARPTVSTTLARLAKSGEVQTASAATCSLP